MSALETALAAHWAMVPDTVETLLSIADRTHDATPEALEAYRAAHAERGERLKVRDGVGILDVTGPLFKRANLFTSISGATSYDVLRRDLQAALDNPDIHSVLLNVDSPGGEANGCDELAQAIYAARGKKNITAFVSGQACSGGYWIASAAEKIVVSDLAMLGSIGVVLGVTDRKRADEKSGVTRIEFVSSQSPGKRPDILTDAGKAQIQKMVDDLGAVFVSAVAKHRGVDATKVTKEFGAGGVEIGANAVAKGMADEVGQFEATLAALKSRGHRRSTSTGYISMSEQAPAAVETVDVAKIAETSANDTKARIKSITTCDEGKAHPALATHLAFETNMPAAEALGILKAAGPAKPAKVEGDDTGANATIEERAAQTGALDLGKPDARNDTGVDQAEIDSQWSKHAAKVNARLGADAV